MGDLAAVHRVYAIAARHAYAAILSVEQLETMTAVWRRPEPSHELTVAVQDDEVIGFVYVGPGESPGLGYLYDLFVDPAWHGRGVAAGLMEAGHAAMTGMGITRRLLWLLEGNERAAAFYRRHGWHHDGTRVMSSRGVPRLRYQHVELRPVSGHLV